MLNFTGSLKIYVATDPADLRKSFNGLYALTVNVLKGDPQSGALFVFCNKRRNRVKVLYWDGTGLWVLNKRLEKGTFAWPKGVKVKNGKLPLRPEALALLLDGVDLRGGSLRPWYQR
ncbi:IS66 family insertion sequence element accessory protein TnpB [Verrucomicrobiota bacterium]